MPTELILPWSKGCAIPRSGRWGQPSLIPIMLGPLLLVIHAMIFIPLLGARPGKDQG